MKEDIRWSSMFLVPELQEAYDHYELEKVHLIEPCGEDLPEELELRLRHAENRQYTVTLIVYAPLGPVGYNGLITVEMSRRRVKVRHKEDVNSIRFEDILGVVAE